MTDGTQPILLVKKLLLKRKIRLATFRFKIQPAVQISIFTNITIRHTNNIVIEIPDKELFESLYGMRNGIIITILILLAVVFLITTILANSITTRLNKAVTLAKNISEGDLTSSIPIDSSDELAELAHALNQNEQYSK